MISIPVFEIAQPVGSFYVGVIQASNLLSICKYDYRRMQFKNDYIDFLGIQRELNPKRIDQIKKYVGTIDACFPTSVVISIDEKCAQLDDTDLIGVKILKISDYVDAEGNPGSFQLMHQVYGREGEACSRCRTAIRRIVVGQRGTHYCPKCQR